MKRFHKYTSLLAVFVASMWLVSCANYVQNVEPLIDVIDDPLLNSQAQVPFIINGVNRQLALAASQMVTLAELQSDAFYFDTRVPNSTFPTFADIDACVPQLDNNSSNNQWGTLGNYRFHADNLVERALGKITFTSDAAGTAARANALFNGYLHGGIVRYFYASYYGLNPNEGGGVIAGGPFIASQAMYDSAIARFNLALANANAVQARIVNTWIAKANLAAGRYPAARTAALAGMVRNDAAFTVLYDPGTITNTWWTDGGRGRCQMIPDNRFEAYIRADSLEGRFFPATIAGTIINAVGSDADFAASLTTRRLMLFGPLTNGGLRFHMSGRFPNQNSAQVLASWQENELILAETAARNGDNAGALVNVNNVRTFHNLAARTVTNTDSIYIERDKQLFAQGTRIIDQRRFGRWHTSTPQSGGIAIATTAWRFLPIGLPERNVNQNLPR